MSDNDPGVPQFATAEYTQTAEGDQCAFCKQMIGGNYYRVNGNMACGSCAAQVQQAAPKDTHANFVRALIFGVGAAILGLAIYAGFAIMTGWMIGYVSLAVGFIVGKAMMMGSKGFGGRKYQIAAVLLTYAAVSLAAVPIAIAHFSKEKPAQQAQQQSTTSAEETSETGDKETATKGPSSFGGAVMYLAFLGLASPFLELADPLHGFIGLVILFVGVQIAWKLAAGHPKLEVTGPYQNS